MKICWDNLEDIHLTREGNFRNPIKMKTYYIKKCSTCGELFLNQAGNKGLYCNQHCRDLTEKGKKKISSIHKKLWSDPEYKKRMSNAHKGHIHSEEHKRKISISNKGRIVTEETRKKIGKSSKGEKNYNWKGGYRTNNIPRYDIFTKQINWCESVRRNKVDKNILEVKCAYCGKWFIPTLSSINSRIQSLSGNTKGENRLYCSEECKHECPIYGQIEYPKGFKQATSREVQPQLRQMVLERDNWECQKCRSTKSLHCHHLEGIRWEPLMSADTDMCITLCKSCHIKVHKLPDCGYHDQRCDQPEQYIGEQIR